MNWTKIELTPEQSRLVKEYELLEAEYGILSYRRGTDGEKGLYHKMKKARKEINKMKELFKNKWGLKIYTSGIKLIICTIKDYEEYFGKS